MGAREAAQAAQGNVQTSARVRYLFGTYDDRLDTELQTPTYASFLSWIECHFWAIGEFVVKNGDCPDWDAPTKAMNHHIACRNGPHRDQRLLKAGRRLLIAARSPLRSQCFKETYERGPVGGGGPAQDASVSDRTSFLARATGSSWSSGRSSY